MLEVMVQLTDDNPLSTATTLDMLQLVNMIAQNIYCYFPDRRVGRCWNQMIKIIFRRGREGEVSKLKKNKKEVKTFFHLNIYNIVSSYDDIPQHYRCWTITLDTHLSQNLWRQCWLCLNFSKNKKKNLHLHVFRISVAILSRRYSRSIFQMCYLICICIHG